MSDSRRPSQDGTGGNSAASVLRVDPCKRLQVRLLSAAYGGLFTHWYRGRSVYCRGADCGRGIHATQRTWKGYACVELWLTDAKLWLPTVLEITEHLELDFRGLWKRGHTWQLFRGPTQHGKRSPVHANWIEDTEDLQLPKPLDLYPVLQHLYHEELIDLTHANPLPQRPVAIGRSAPPPTPRPLDKAEPQFMTPEDRQLLREMLANRVGKPTNGGFTSNGKRQPEKEGDS